MDVDCAQYALPLDGYRNVKTKNRPVDAIFGQNYLELEKINVKKKVEPL